MSRWQKALAVVGFLFLGISPVVPAMAADPYLSTGSPGVCVPESPSSCLPEVRTPDAVPTPQHHPGSLPVTGFPVLQVVLLACFAIVIGASITTARRWPR